ncbi:A disintegrin and metalloproteinase with thrombospondin motifs 6-like [Amphiura filiformis]|uniref:A disintegrin and metalloproteinase with thrombospondin motifs 6-like n=1 Tax=Amphiura filiformis TaxID=82378 RepID=UPI003B2210B2
MNADELRTNYGTVPLDSEDLSDLELVNIWDNQPTGDSPLHTGFEFTAFGEDFRARVYENRHLMRPDLHVERWGKAGRVSSEPVQQGCYYLGKLMSHNNSVVAVNKCSGMTGIISYGDHDLYILPLTRNHTEIYRNRFSRDADGINPHIIHKRTTSASDSINSNSQFCSTDDIEDFDPDSGLTRTKQYQSAMEENLQSRGVEYFMELLVVADNKMRMYHKEGLESYVMTLLNIVSRLFIDPTLGVNIRLYIVRFIVLESDAVGTSTDMFPHEGAFTVQTDVNQLLPDFCKFQDVLNPMDDTDKDHWDNAIFISRYDLFDSKKQKGRHSIVGQAPIGQTCTRPHQCSINEDYGLKTGIVIAHETGHNLGLSHDSTYGCQTKVNIMSGTQAYGAGSFEWSSCSRKNIRSFLENPTGSCLKDKPFVEPVPVDVPSLNIQCALMFGQGFSVVDEWCISGECVDPSDVIDGAWSSWETDKSQCSRSCGRGVQQLRKRFCDNPLPMYGGKECPGDSIEYEVCNIHHCDRSQDDFRDEQCAATNNEPHNGEYYEWIGYVAGLSSVALCGHVCTKDDGKYGEVYRGVYRPPYQFIDGTQCWDDEDADSNIIKLCVAGYCMEFGCDGKRHSNLVFDSCGVCGGDGSSCQKIEDSFSGGDGKGRFNIKHVNLIVYDVKVYIFNKS